MPPRPWHVFRLPADLQVVAVAAVLASHPDAIASAVPAAAVEGCNRTVLLWQWMGSVT